MCFGRRHLERGIDDRINVRTHRRWFCPVQCQVDHDHCRPAAPPGTLQGGEEGELTRKLKVQISTPAHTESRPVHHQNVVAQVHSSMDLYLCPVHVDILLLQPLEVCGDGGSQLCWHLQVVGPLQPLDRRPEEGRTDDIARAGHGVSLCLPSLTSSRSG